jgi:opacity protein-like surface antigen
MRKATLGAIIFVGLAALNSWGQKVELTAFIGGQTNGGMNLSTSLFQRIDVKNGRTSGLSAGYLLGDHYGLEFMWSYNKANTVAQPRGSGSDITIFTLDTNQYLGNFVFHFGPKEKSFRPFLMAGFGGTNLSPAREGVSSSTRFAWDVGGGVKYNFSRHFGLRLQAKWSPVYLTTTKAGYWCDPYWGGCWAVGDNHYLNEFDATAGITLRF